MTTLDTALAVEEQRWYEQRAQREQLGDDLNAPRQIDHFAYFTRRSAAEAAAEEFRQAGFAVRTSRHRLRVVLEASRNEALSDLDVLRFMDEVLDIVLRHRGRYDGWGGAVVDRAMSAR